MERGAVVAASLATASGAGLARGPGAAADMLGGPAGVAWDETGTIVYVGEAGELPWSPSAGRPDRGSLAPGFVDCHVHLPFLGWRADEYEARLRGVSYRELHGTEGGIYRSSRLFREGSDDDVLAFCLPLLAEMAAHGTTTTELKTGYGLSVDQELRHARLARRLADEVPQTCRVTLLACHAVPHGMDRREWVRTACDDLIPAAAAQGLADQVDIYVEDIAFSLDDLAQVADAASNAGLPLRVHAEQLGPTGAAEAAVGLGARSADHLNHCSAAGVAALGGDAQTVAVLLPTSTFFLRAKAAPAAALRAAGAAVALATDCNPGTSPVVSMPEAIAMGCALYGLSPLDALSAATANAACVLGLNEQLGRLAVGMRADLVLLDGLTIAQIAYRPGHNPVVATWFGGELRAGDPDRISAVV
jgi:imidazolonepropionase